MLDYRVITKEDYKKLRLNSLSASNISKETIKEVDKDWDELRKGYSFIISVGKEDKAMLYSVEYFNEHVLHDKSKPNALTIRLGLDTTEFEDKLSRIEKQLERIKALNEVKNITINNYKCVEDVAKKLGGTSNE